MEPAKEERRAMTIRDFSSRYRIGRTLIYEEIAAGRLQARKVANRTLILQDEAEAWSRALPTIKRKRGHAAQ
jgi:hypothetical protein